MIIFQHNYVRLSLTVSAPGRGFCCTWGRGDGYIVKLSETVKVTKNPPADTAGREEEPVHEDPGTVVVGVVGQQSVPLVLLLAGTVSATAGSRLAATDLLVDGLLELLVVEDGPHLAVAVAGPVRCDDLYGGATHVLSAVK